MLLSQHRFPLTVTSPFAPGSLRVQALRGREAVSEPFRYEVELESDDGALDLAGAVGKELAVAVERTGAGPRYVHGVVTRFAQEPAPVRAARYRAELRPRLWLLTLRAGCRIFQGRTVPQILDELFAGHAVRSALQAAYEPRDFCVQYRESDFAFASRLMEDAGIAYYFEHAAGGHTLVLADDAQAFEPCPELPTARLRPAGTGAELDDAVTACTLEHAATTDRVQLDDYNFQTPSAALLASSAGDRDTHVAFDYPGGFDAQAAGERVARRRWEERTADAARLAGTSTCRGFVAGHRFSLAGHGRDDANAAWVLRAVSLRADQDGYANEFEAFPAGTAFRPPRRTPRPVIAGTQTAVVVGRAGEEIWTDDHGRVKVRFHWDHAKCKGEDRAEIKDEDRSCWVRVAQAWAGKGWGAMVLPRVGQEVVVSFLEGDPDRPLVTGCVYNAANITPYALPEKRTRSTFRSSSSPGDAVCSEISFEDSAGAEELYLLAGRDLTVDVANDHAATVHEGNDTLEVKKGKRSVTVAEGDETLTVGKGTRTVTVKGDETHVNGATFTHRTDGAYTLKVTGNLVIEATGSITLTAGTSLTAKGGTALQATAGTTFTAKGGVSAEVSSGGVSTVKGTLVKVNA
jgi:type VI secretion system secreted protein VgrG